MPAATRSTCVSCNARLTMGDDETTCADCLEPTPDAPRSSMLGTLLERLRACRHPMRAWLMEKLATPEADRAIAYWKAQSEAGEL